VRSPADRARIAVARLAGDRGSRCARRVAGLCFAGCATEPETGESAASQEVSTGVRCSDKSWKVNFYSDASLTTLVGAMSCTCFAFEQLTGTTSNFSTLVFERQCEL
jgi:hypothetical protein